MDNLGEQVVAEQELKQQLASENKTLKNLLDQVSKTVDQLPLHAHTI